MILTMTLFILSIISYVTGYQFINEADKVPIVHAQISNNNTVIDTNSSQNMVLPSSFTSGDLSQLFKQAERSVVQVTGNSNSSNHTQDALESRLGSGFIYDKQGHVLTNNHVIAGGGKEFEVTFLDGSSYKAIVIGADPYADLAVLKIIDVSGDRLFPLKLGNSSSVTVGQRVVAIGNPFGLSGSMTEGIVSGLGRILPSASTEQNPSNPSTSLASTFSIPNIIQTDAAINPGNSGGPLLNMRGEVLGINTAIFSNTGLYSGVGFAIPSDMIEKIVPSLISKGIYNHPYLGIAGVDVNSDIAENMGLNDTKGFLVVSVVLDGPADKAGIRGGDVITDINGMKMELGGDVIVGIDNTTVRKIEDILSYLERNKSVGETVNLEIIRDGKAEKIRIPLDTRPATTIPDPRGSSYSQPVIGISGLDMTPEIADRTNLTTATGFLVVNVSSDSPADKAGIRGGYKTTDINGMKMELGGDVIVGIDNTTVRKIEDIQSYLMTKKVGDKVSLSILRDGLSQKISLVLESKKLGESDLFILPPNLKLEPPKLPPVLPPHSPSIPPPQPPSQSFPSDDVITGLYNNCIQVTEINICDKIFGK
jgi:S1-C subfamily serine protease